MKADFTQTVYDNKNKAIMKSYGRMAMQRPGKFRWEVTKPIPQVIIANSTRLWIYDPDLEQVTIRALKKAAGETPALLLSHVDMVLSQSYQVEQVPSKTPGTQSFSLMPKGQDNMFASIQMNFANNKIQSMQLRDHLGHTTLVLFQHTQTNPSLPASLFNFKPPARTDVIDETKR
jgi:outer membrane lipoprotein carrier protein